MAESTGFENQRGFVALPGFESLPLRHFYGLWIPKQRKPQRVFQLRPRRERFGELIQIDGSPHDWFEGRSGSCTLIVFIDDATSKLTSLQFSRQRQQKPIWTY